MVFKEITSRENPLIKLVLSLQSSAKKRRENGLFVLEGLRICLDAFENGIKFEKLIITPNVQKKFASEIESFSENSKECYLISDDLFKKISDTSSPQGIIALALIPESDNAVLRMNGRYIALENLNDPSNLGAVSRTAEALGVSGIILSDGSCDPYSPKALRASMGTLLRMPVFVLNDFMNDIINAGLTTYSCVVDKDAESINNSSFCDGSVIIIGNEANGITDETKALSDKRITIPMSGRADSLNAAVAASIAMWELMKQ